MLESMSPKDTAARRLARHLASTAAGRFAGLVVGIALSPLLLTDLGPAGFGAWALALAVSIHASVITELGSGTALIYGVAQARAEGDARAAARALGCHLSWCCGVLTTGLFAAPLLTPLVSAWLAHLLGSTRVEPVSQLLLAATLSGLAKPALLSWDCLLQGQQRHARSARLATLRALAWAALALTTLRLGGGPLELVLADLALAVALAPIGFLDARRGSDGALLARPGPGELRAHLGYGLRVYASLMAELVQGQSDKLLLGFERGSIAVQSYELGQKIPLTGRGLLGLLGQVLMPATPTLGDRAAITELHRRVQTALNLGSMLLFGFTALAAPRLLGAWLGSERVDPDMISCLRILSLAAAASCASLAAVHLARGLGQLEVELRCALCFGILGVASRALGLWLWGLEGLLLAIAVSACALALAQHVNLAPELGYQAFERGARTALRPALASLAALAPVLAYEAFAAPLSAGREQALIDLASELALFAPTALVTSHLSGADEGLVSRLFGSLRGL